MIDKNRQTVLDRRDYYDITQLAGQPVGHAVTQLGLLQYQYEGDIDKGRDVRLACEPYGYDGGMEWYVEIYRLENDKEYSARLKREHAAAEKSRKIKEAKKERARKELYRKEADERAEYERLRAKFGD